MDPKNIPRGLTTLDFFGKFFKCLNLGNNCIYDQKAEFCNKYMQLYSCYSAKSYECECTEYTLNRLEYNIILPTIKKTGRKPRCIREQIIGIVMASERDFDNMTCLRTCNLNAL